MRHVAAAAYNAHTDPIFHNLNLLKFDDLYTFNLSTFIFNLSRGLPPASIKSIFVPMGGDNRSNNYIQDKYKYTYLKQQVPATLIRNWESVSTADKNLIYK